MTGKLVTVGNPNVGKSTLVGALAGNELEVGNWPGTTVDRTVTCFAGYELIDLPGCYSLEATTPEEEITRHELLESNPDLVLNVVDAGNLERNLYLTLELLELGIPMLVVLNLVDEAEQHGRLVDAKALAAELGVTVVETVASRRQGLEQIENLLKQPAPRALVDYGPDLEARIAPLMSEGRNRRWLAVNRVTAQGGGPDQADAFLKVLDARFERAQQIANRVTRREERPPSLTEKLDRLVLHPLLGFPVFLGAMLLTFRFTFAFSDPWIEFTGVLQEVLGGWIQGLAVPSFVRSLLAEGVVAGLGTVVAFAPVLFFLYLAMSFLESSGFLARIATLTDRLMSLVGLPGRGFIPLVLGFGCNVPAIYATRALESFSERLRVALAIPFMACSARLAVFTLFAVVFFPEHGALVVFGLYLAGLAAGLGTAALLSRITEESPTSGIMELPPYRMPTLRLVVRSAWGRTVSFIRGAGGMITGAVLVVWLLLNLPPGGMEQSLYGKLAGAVASVFAPMGVTDWRLIGALLPGFIAKEVVIGTLGVSFLGGDPQAAMTLVEGLSTLGQGLWAATLATVNAVPALFGLPNLVPPAPEAPGGLPAALAPTLEQAGALAYLVFLLLYTPCVATVAAIRDEFGPRWATFTVFYQLGVAYLAAVAVYHIGGYWW